MRGEAGYVRVQPLSPTLRRTGAEERTSLDALRSHARRYICTPIISYSYLFWEGRSHQFIFFRIVHLYLSRVALDHPPQNPKFLKSRFFFSAHGNFFFLSGPSKILVSESYIHIPSVQLFRRFSRTHRWRMPHAPCVVAKSTQ